MKRLLVFAAAVIFATGSVMAQGYMIINSQTIFKSIDEYTKAVEEIDDLAQKYQDNIDKAYAQIEEQYNAYMKQRSSLSQSQQQQREDAIISNEKNVAEYQEKVFGNEGIIAKMREDKLEPIQKNVFDVIAKYAKENNYGLALDVATNPLVVYYDPANDKTNQIIEILK